MSTATSNAEAALARIDDGVELPGDRLLAASFEDYCRHEWLVFADREHAAREATELARACPVCVPGGSGPECDPCSIADDSAARRREDM
jgi:hypothetical protein